MTLGEARRALADAFRARVIDAGTESFVFELTGASDKIDSFINLMLPLGLVGLWGARHGVYPARREEPRRRPGPRPTTDGDRPERSG